MKTSRAKREEQLFNLLRWNTGRIEPWDKDKIKQMSNRELGLSIASQQRLKRMRA